MCVSLRREEVFSLSTAPGLAVGRRLNYINELFCFLLLRSHTSPAGDFWSGRPPASAGEQPLKFFYYFHIKDTNLFCFVFYHKVQSRC